MKAIIFKSVSFCTARVEIWIDVINARCNFTIHLVEVVLRTEINVVSASLIYFVLFKYRLLSIYVLLFVILKIN